MEKWTIKKGKDENGNITLEECETGKVIGVFDRDDGYLNYTAKLSEERMEEIARFRRKFHLTTADW